MQNITKETRQEAYVLKPNRQRQILEVLGSRAMTARQIAYEMGFSDLNAVKPRLTELSHEGLITAVDKAKDSVTGRRVALWQRVEE